ncbi:MAG: macro domain-containing protein, partial [Ruminiclostridium sp.]|nr:macro domain-containing protein [Ruminiclostridium sp.]
MPFIMIRQDITKMQVDAIVNAANNNLIMGGGVCGAIFKAANPIKLQIACAKVSPIKTGCAVITPGFNLPAKYVIHAAGPRYSRQNADESEKLLRSSYTNSLELALENKCESIAFPLISSGIYGYPKKEALQVAVSAIKDFLADHDMEVYLVIFDRDSYQVSEKLLNDVESYIDEKYVKEHYVNRREEISADRGLVC